MVLATSWGLGAGYRDLLRSLHPSQLLSLWSSTKWWWLCLHEYLSDLFGVNNLSKIRWKCCTGYCRTMLCNAMLSRICTNMKHDDMIRKMCHSLLLVSSSPGPIYPATALTSWDSSASSVPPSSIHKHPLHTSSWSDCILILCRDLKHFLLACFLCFKPACSLPALLVSAPVAWPIFCPQTLLIILSAWIS